MGSNKAWPASPAACTKVCAGVCEARCIRPSATAPKATPAKRLAVLPIARTGPAVPESALVRRGEVTGASKIRRQVPVEEYLRPQKRYAHLFSPKPREDVIRRIQEAADKNIRKYGLLETTP